MIVDSLNENFNETQSSLPFSAYYFLIVITFFNTNFRAFLNYIHLYNILLIMISPFLIILLLNGNYWIAPIINAHEVAYKGIFLCIGMLMFSKKLKYSKE